MIEVASSKIYDFGDFRLEGKCRRLSRRESGDQIPLTPKAADLLLVLVENRGRVLSKDELLETVWGNSFVEESNLSQTVFVLRKCLGETAKQARFILTKPGLGYQFIAPVITVLDDDSILNETLVSDGDTRQPVDTDHPRPRSRRFLAFCLLFTLLLAAAGSYWFYPRKPASSSVRINSLAVIPFQGMEGSADRAYLGPGLAEVLTTKLSRIKSVVVRSPAASMKYSTGVLDLKTAGTDLAVDAIVTGSIQSSGNDLRINVQLVRVADGATIWAETFDSKLSNILEVQDSIAQQVSDSLAIQLAQTERNQVARNYTANAEAFQLYLQGRFLWSKRTPEAFFQAIAEFNKAKQLDPAYALAYVGAAQCYVLLPQYHAATPEDAYAKAKIELQRALSIDSELADAHSTLADVQAFYDRDGAAAEASFRRALELDPNSVTTRQWYAEFLFVSGRQDEADAQLKRAQAVEPRSALVMSALAGNQYYRRDYAGAIEYSRRTISLDPNLVWGHLYLGLALEHQGDFPGAVDALIKAMQSSGEPPEAAEQLKRAFEKGGITGFWRQRLVQLETQPHLKYFPPMGVAVVHARLGNREKALQLLQTAYEQRDHNIGGLRFAVDFDSLLDDPRYQKLLAQVGK